MFHKMSRRLRLSLCATRRAESSFFATVRHDFFLLAALANYAQTAIRGNAAFEERLKLLNDIARQRTTLSFAVSDKGAEMILDDPVARRELGAPPLVGAWFLDAGRFHGRKVRAGTRPMEVTKRESSQMSVKHTILSARTHCRGRK